MMWMWMSAIIVLCGAELNSEIEHQTARDSTVGPPKPLGARGASMADTVGRTQFPARHKTLASRIKLSAKVAALGGALRAT